MFSLSKIATFAVLALGTVASAVPAKRQDTDAVSILNTLTSDVTPVAAQFTTLTADNATAENVQPIVDQINSLVSAANTKLAALPAGSADTNSTVEALANVYTAILTPANTLVTTEGVDAASIIPIFTQLGITLAALLQNVVTLVQEVLEVVVELLQGLIAGLSGILGNLGLGSILGL
ncbi:hypothetical protein PENSPDRAFT_689140 [Peniophora sp. CONT]|nr:hypothetical protein PENSPDRAFT_689140 [Peniophora sp. CONT]